jgi:hypothetical protein
MWLDAVVPSIIELLTLIVCGIIVLLSCCLPISQGSACFYRILTFFFPPADLPPAIIACISLFCGMYR